MLRDTQVSANAAESYELSDKPEMKAWLDELRQSEKMVESREKEWDRYIGYYKNNVYDIRSNDDRVNVNYIFAVTQTAKPQLYFKNPYTTVQPRRVREATKEDERPISTQELIDRVQGTEGGPLTAEGELKPEKRSRYVETILNYEYDECNFKKQIKKCVLDARLYGIAYVKLGYAFKQESVAKKKENGRVDYEERIRKDHIFVYRLSPKQVLVPVGYDEIENMPWVAIKFLKPEKEVKNNDQYKNTSKVRGETVNINDFYSTKKNNKAPKDEASKEKFVLLYEIWDRRNEEVITIDSNGVELRRIDWPYKMEGFPIERLSFIDIPDQYYPESPVKYLEPQMRELNKYRTRQIRHNARFNRKYLVDYGKVEKQEAQKLKIGDDGCIIGGNNIDGNTVQPIQDAPLPVDNRLMQADCKDDIMIMSGFGELQLQSSSAKFNSATEANIVEQNKKLRIDEDADTVVDFVNRISRKQVQLILQFYDRKMVVRLTGEDAKGWTTIVDKGRIQGEYDVKVEAGSTLPYTVDVRREQYLKVLNVLTAPIFQGKVNVDGLALELIKTFENIKNPEDYVNVEGQGAEAVLRAGNENELMSMGRETHATPADSHITHLKRHIEYLKSQPAGTFEKFEQMFGLPPGTIEGLFAYHIEEHKAFLQQASLAGQRNGSPIGGSAPASGVGFSGAMPNMTDTQGMQSPPPGQPAYAEAGQ